MTLSNASLFTGVQQQAKDASKDASLIEQMTQEFSTVFNDPQKLKEWLAKELFGTPAAVEEISPAAPAAMRNVQRPFRKVSEHQLPPSMTPIREENNDVSPVGSMVDGQKISTASVVQSVQKSTEDDSKKAAKDQTTKERRPESKKKSHRDSEVSQQSDSSAETSASEKSTSDVKHANKKAERVKNPEIKGEKESTRTSKGGSKSKKERLKKSSSSPIVSSRARSDGRKSRKTQDETCSSDGRTSDEAQSNQ
jgi:hypothetical protein